MSARSIEAATTSAKSKYLAIEYRCENYCETHLNGPYDLITMISCDFGVLLPLARMNLASNIASSLKPRGVFAFDVWSLNHKNEIKLEPDLHHFDRGFWAATPDVVLSQSWLYETHECVLDQNAVLFSNGDVKVYRRWEQLFNQETLMFELDAVGLEVASITSDLAGGSDLQGSSRLGVLAHPTDRSDVLTFPLA